MSVSLDVTPLRYRYSSYAPLCAALSLRCQHLRARLRKFVRTWMCKGHGRSNVHVPYTVPVINMILFFYDTYDTDSYLRTLAANVVPCTYTLG
jgi:hypothetical protein